MLVSTAIHIPIVIYVYNTDRGDMLPHEHTLRPISRMISLTPRHRYVEVPVSEDTGRQFGTLALGMDGERLRPEDGAIAVQHVTIKSDAIQVERSYTPINDVEEDGVMKLIVKKVKGGEIGR